MLFCLVSVIIGLLTNSASVIGIDNIVKKKKKKNYMAGVATAAVYTYIGSIVITYHNFKDQNKLKH